MKKCINLFFFFFSDRQAVQDVLKSQGIIQLVICILQSQENSADTKHVKLQHI